MHQLLASPLLQGAEVIGGGDHLDVAVSDIVLRRNVDRDTMLAAGEALILDGDDSSGHTYRIDVAIRLLVDARGAGLIVVNPPVGYELSARRLGNRLGVAVVALESEDCSKLAHELRAEMWHVDVVNAALMNEALRVLGGRRLTTVEDVVAYLGSVTTTRCALLSNDRELVVGDSIELGSRRLANSSAHLADRSERAALHSAPVVLAPGEPISYWLVAESEASDSSQRALSSILSLGSWYLATLLAAARVRAERDARQRIAVLNHILDTSDPHEGELRSQMMTLGWSASGWNTALHIRLQGHQDSSRLTTHFEELRERLVEVGLDGPLIERNDGWSGWVTTGEEPPATSFPEMMRLLDLALQRFVAAHDGLMTHAGIGRPHRELDGLRKSLAEANEASLIAQAHNRERSAIEHIDQIGVQRILMGWFASEEFAQYATSVLLPLASEGSDNEMVPTLEAYLDANCSTTDAALALGVHRNTVTNRIRRVSETLGVDLEDPETRLSLQLACRMSRLRGS